jgi:hypothetical protein
MQNPAEQLTDALIDARNAGQSFPEAWERSLASVDWPTDYRARSEWRRALEWAEREFADAYCHPESAPTSLMRVFEEPNESLIDEQAAEITADLVTA